jgi:hypothetical protein
MEWLDNVLRSFEKGARRRNHQEAKAKEEAKAVAKAGRPPAKDARPTPSRGAMAAHEAAPRSPREEVGIALGRTVALYYRSSTLYQIHHQIH